LETLAGDAKRLSYAQSIHLLLYVYNKILLIISKKLYTIPQKEGRP